MTPDPKSIDWTALQRLRTAFLESAGGARDYWLSDSDLSSYDETFARRIQWKWTHVLTELARRGWRPPTEELVDWGCGTGIASRTWLAHFNPRPASVILVDRSAAARSFAAQRLISEHPGITVRESAQPDPGLDHKVVLLSHVLTELDAKQEASLLQSIRDAAAIVWIEPGTREAGQRLVRIRENLRTRLRLVAPCPHQEQCGLLASGMERHWCHHFAAPPLEAFTQPHWTRFARWMGVDLRSLPLSYLVLDGSPDREPGREAQVRILGRPRVYKGHALIFGCEKGGVHERRLLKRRSPEIFRRLTKGRLSPLVAWQCEGNEVVSMKEVE